MKVRKTKTLLFITGLLLFISSNIQAQVINIPFTFSDGIDTRTRNVGLDPTATTGIDPALGEENLPPFPAGMEVRFDLNPFGVAGQVYKDYRNAPFFPFSGTVEHRLIWQYSAGATGFTINYNFPTGVQMRLTDAINGFVFNSGILSGQGSYLIPFGTGFTAAKLFMIYESALPVELVFFSASYKNNKINLKWQTATETNNYGFEVERKTPVGNWQKIGFIPGYGNSNSPKEYSYIDNKVSGGSIFQYRLKQLDADGAYKYSGIVEVELNLNEFTLDQNYPNPFNPTTTISFSVPIKGSVKLLVYNQIGQLVDEFLNSVLEAGAYNYTWNAKNLSSGIYFYEIQTNDFKSIKKMILIK